MDQPVLVPRDVNNTRAARGHLIFLGVAIEGAELRWFTAPGVSQRDGALVASCVESARPADSFASFGPDSPTGPPRVWLAHFVRIGASVSFESYLVQSRRYELGDAGKVWEVTLVREDSPRVAS